MPFVRPEDMLQGEPLPGWKGRFFHSANVTFAHYELAPDATPLHPHFHEQEEVWHVVDGEVAVTVDGVERTLRRGDVAVVPPNVVHSVTPISGCRVVIADFPLRPSLPGMSEDAPHFG